MIAYSKFSVEDFGGLTLTNP